MATNEKGDPSMNPSPEASDHEIDTAQPTSPTVDDSVQQREHAFREQRNIADRTEDESSSAPAQSSSPEKIAQPDEEPQASVQGADGNAPNVGDVSGASDSPPPLVALPEDSPLRRARRTVEQRQQQLDRNNKEYNIYKKLAKYAGTEGLISPQGVSQREKEHVTFVEELEQKKSEPGDTKRPAGGSNSNIANTGGVPLADSNRTTEGRTERLEHNQEADRENPERATYSESGDLISPEEVARRQEEHEAFAEELARKTAKSLSLEDDVPEGLPRNLSRTAEQRAEQLNRNREEVEENPDLTKYPESGHLISPEEAAQRKNEHETFAQKLDKDDAESSSLTENLPELPENLSRAVRERERESEHNQEELENDPNLKNDPGSNGLISPEEAARRKEEHEEFAEELNQMSAKSPSPAEDMPDRSAALSRTAEQRAQQLESNRVELNEDPGLADYPEGLAALASNDAARQREADHLAFMRERGLISPVKEDAGKKEPLADPPPYQPVEQTHGLELTPAVPTPALEPPLARRPSDLESPVTITSSEEEECLSGLTGDGTTQAPPLPEQSSSDDVRTPTLGTTPTRRRGDVESTATITPTKPESGKHDDTSDGTAWPPSAPPLSHVDAPEAGTAETDPPTPRDNTPTPQVNAPQVGVPSNDVPEDGSGGPSNETQGSITNVTFPPGFFGFEPDDPIPPLSQMSGQRPGDPGSSGSSTSSGAGDPRKRGDGDGGVRSPPPPGPKDDRPKDDAPKKGGPKKGGPKKGGPKKDAPKKDTQKLDAPKPDAPKSDSPKQGTPKKGTPKKDTPKRDSSEKDTPKKDAPKEDEPKQDAPMQDAPKQDEPKKDTPKKDPPKKNPPKKDSPRKDPLRKDPPAKDTPKNDPPKKDSPKKDTPKKDSPKKDSPKIDQPRPHPPGDRPQIETPQEDTSQGNAPQDWKKPSDGTQGSIPDIQTPMPGTLGPAPGPKTGQHPSGSGSSSSSSSSEADRTPKGGASHRSASPPGDVPQGDSSQEGRESSEETQSSWHTAPTERWSSLPDLDLIGPTSETQSMGGVIDTLRESLAGMQNLEQTILGDGGEKKGKAGGDDDDDEVGGGLPRRQTTFKNEADLDPDADTGVAQHNYGRFIRRGLPNQIRELTTRVRLIRARHAEHLGDGMRCIILAGQAKNSAAHIEYAPLTARCVFWRGLGELRQGQFENAVASLREAEPVRGRYIESERLDEWRLRARQAWRRDRNRRGSMGLEKMAQVQAKDDPPEEGEENLSEEEDDPLIRPYPHIRLRKGEEAKQPGLDLRFSPTTSVSKGVTPPRQAGGSRESSQHGSSASRTGKRHRRQISLEDELNDLGGGYAGFDVNISEEVEPGPEKAPPRQTTGRQSSSFQRSTRPGRPSQDPESASDRTHGTIVGSEEQQEPETKSTLLGQLGKLIGR